jgi:hypothetical protein
MTESFIKLTGDVSVHAIFYKPISWHLPGVLGKATKEASASLVVPQLKFKPGPPPPIKINTSNG